MKRVNQSLDQAEGLIDMRLLEQAKAILNKLDTEFKTRMPEYDYKWDFAVARFIFVRWRWKHLFTEKALPWMEEIASLVQSMSFSHSSHSRPYVPSPNTSPQTREQWSGSAILLQLRWLHAKHFAEYRAQLDALQEMVSQPVLRNYRNARIEETPSQQGQADKEGYSEPLTAVEQFFLRLNIIEFAASHGDLHTVQSYLGEPYEIPPAKVLYPACNLWSAYQFYQGRMAYMFQGKQLVEDRGNGFSLDDFLEFWKMTTAEAIEGLPLRMEIHQILILCGSGQFSKALQRIKELLKVRENKANPDLRMLEILSIYQCGKEAYEPAYPLLTMANKKAKDNPEWQFVKCFAICLSVTLPVAIFIGPNGRWLLLTADQIRESQSTFG